MANGTGVEHIVDATESWQLGLLGFVARLRGLITANLIALPFIGVPWWITAIPADAAVTYRKLSIWLAILACLQLVAGWFYLRSRARRSLRMKAGLHRIARLCREYIDAVSGRTKGPLARGKAIDIPQERAHFRDFADAVCEAVAAYFESLTRETGIAAALRLAADDPHDGKREAKYVTVGWSAGFSRDRRKTTEPIARNEGVPGFFIKRQDSGVLLYSDLVLAAQNDAYKLTDNDMHFAAETKGLLVSPVLGWEGEGVGLLGLLYVASRSERSFKAKHIDNLRACAECIAMACIALEIRMKDITGIRDLVRQVQEEVDAEHEAGE